MKRWLNMMGILAGLVLVAAPASAQVNLSWQNCNVNGTADRTFACDTNTGSHTMVASFIAPAGVDMFTAAELIFDIKAATDPIPDWWELRNQTGQSGQCRNGSISANVVMGAYTGCDDPYAGQGSGGIGTYRLGGPSPETDMSRVRLTMVFAVPVGSEQALTPGNEYFAANVVINNSKTVGTTPCTGCTVPTSTVLNGVRVVQPAGHPVGNILLTAPAVNRTITWQGGAGAAPVPTRATTWSQVKTLFR